MLFHSINITIISLLLLSFSSAKAQKHSIKTDTTAYFKLLKKIRSDRDSIFRVYQSASDQEKQQHLNRAEEYLVSTYYKKLLPYWEGTTWEFYGETQIPGDSSIACGHFVVTTLKHLGINPEHSHEMATNFSAYMVNSLCDSSYKVYKPEALIEIVKKHPDDIWVVGLHNHSGLLVNYQGQLHFFHSSYSYPTAVVDELAGESHTFQHSTIYVAGNLFRNNSLTLKWMEQQQIRYTKKY